MNMSEAFSNEVIMPDYYFNNRVCPQSFGGVLKLYIFTKVYMI